ncbi:MAG: VWA domain-containing protein [candidate division Zixibacteria bacterium]|nr:VWA domain-containing protein [candidate division Zixibacteria bacterium]
MFEFQYTRYLPEEKTLQERLEELFRLLSQLLIYTNGDVDEALKWMQYIDRRNGLFDEELGYEEFVKELEKQGYIKREETAFKLTEKGGRRIREDSLKQIFTSLKKGLGGSHETPFHGEGVERLSETRPYRFGDQAANIDFTLTIGNAIRRDGFDMHLKEEDFEVYEVEHNTSCATVMLLDISHSMILYGEDRISPAKRVALALSELIIRKYPKDELHLVLFGDDAQRVAIEALPFVSVGPYHTNTKAGLSMARTILKKSRNVNKQAFMITDGKPSAIYDRNGRLYLNSFGLDPKIVNRTLDEAIACRREKITISTFMVTQDPYLVRFVETLTEMNRGRAYYSSLDNLGEYIFVDYVRNRRRRVN